MNIPTATQTGDIPEIEDGLRLGRFNDVVERVVEKFITDKDQWGHADNGVRYDFDTTPLDENRNPLLRDPSDPDSPEMTLRQAKSVKMFSSDERSNSYYYLKGILTPTELRLWEASGKGDKEADEAWATAAAKINGRIVHIQVTHNDKGWPQIEAFLGPAK